MCSWMREVALGCDKYSICGSRSIKESKDCALRRQELQVVVHWFNLKWLLGGKESRTPCDTVPNKGTSPDYVILVAFHINVER